MLKQLFSIEGLSGRLLFKGGTSLSKIFHAINRFSEDIDLAVDYEALGFKGERDPRRQDISKTKRAGILDEMMAECRRYIGGEFLNVLKARSGEILGATDTWSLHVSEQGPNVVQFRYPTAITKNLDYVSPQVVLELGTHAEFVPHDRFTIRSFAAEEFPNVVADGDVAVVALLAKRTLWEKATILHAEYYRPPEKPILDRYSRHYYDVAMLAQGPIRADALADRDLLTQVVRHKETFYPSAWARYDLAHPGSFRLVEQRRMQQMGDDTNFAGGLAQQIHAAGHGFDKFGRQIIGLAVQQREIHRQGHQQLTRAVMQQRPLTAPTILRCCVKASHASSSNTSTNLRDRSVRRVGRRLAAKRAAAEREARKSRTQFEPFMDNSPGIAYMKDGDGRL